MRVIQKKLDWLNIKLIMEICAIIMEKMFWPDLLKIHHIANIAYTSVGLYKLSMNEFIPSILNRKFQSVFFLYLFTTVPNIFWNLPYLYVVLITFTALWFRKEVAIIKLLLNQNYVTKHKLKIYIFLNILFAII